MNLLERQLHTLLVFLDKLNNQTDIVPLDDMKDYYEDLHDYKAEKEEMHNQLKALHELDSDYTDEMRYSLLAILQQFLNYIDYVEEISDLTKKIFREYENHRQIKKMNEFFLTPFGNTIKPYLSKRKTLEKGQHLYLVFKNFDQRILAQEYVFLSEHRNYLQVADYSGEVKLVLNFDGTTNVEETRKQVGRVLEAEDSVFRQTDWRPSND